MNPALQKSFLKYLVCLALAVITFIAFLYVGYCEFIALDDRSYIVGNSHVQEGFSWNSIKWAFTAFYSNNWHPLTWLSHILDYRLYGLNPAGYHWTNLAFHIANAVLLFLLFQKLTRNLWPSAFVAVLFAIHPMHVESVAWISERKDVLSTVFFLLTLLAYAQYVELAVTKRNLCWVFYGMALVLFALGLMAKPMLVTLPCILCLLDFWPLHRFEWPLKSQPPPLLRRLFLEKIPFVLLAVLSCWVTFTAQNTTGAVKPQVDFALSERLDHVPFSYAWYVLKLFWPVNLSVYYPLRMDNPTWGILAVLFLVMLTGLALIFGRKCPWFFVGWFWFLGMLVPVIGLVQVGDQAYADRYTYLSYVGLFVILAWGGLELVGKWPSQKPLLWAAAVLIVVVCFWRTVVEVRYWKNGETLFSRAIALDPTDELAWGTLGLEYESQGNNDKAISCMTRATTLDNQCDWAWHDLGHMLVLKGDYSKAENAFQMALMTTWFEPDKKNIYNDLGDMFITERLYDRAISNYQESLKLSANQPLVYNNLGLCLVHNDQPGQAAAAFQHAIRLDPKNADPQLNLAILLGNTGHDTDAIPYYRKVIELDTNNFSALNNLAWILATARDPGLRNGKEAVSLAQLACQKTHDEQAILIGTLAAAYAEAGYFDDAVVAAQKAQDVALAHGQKGIAESNARLMQLYKSGQSFHMDTNSLPQKTLP
jgi:Flp pilus assembly protein TadD